MAEDRGLTIRRPAFDRGSWRIEPEDLEPLPWSKTHPLGLNHAGNLTGSIIPVAAVSAPCLRHALRVKRAAR